jgi:hypothetical protein
MQELLKLAMRLNNLTLYTLAFELGDLERYTAGTNCL